MISLLEGSVLHQADGKIIIKTQMGIGYEVYYKGYSQVGENLEIFTAHIIREQSQELFGFKNLIEREMFYLLIGVNGVGPKSAFSLVASVGVEDLKRAIVFEEKKVLTSAPGIGPKAAAQLILSLKDKVDAIKVKGSYKEESFNPEFKNTLDEVLMACNELGFRESDIIPIVKNELKNNSEATPEFLIKQVLREVRRS